MTPTPKQLAMFGEKPREVGLRQSPQRPPRSVVIDQWRLARCLGVRVRAWLYSREEGYEGKIDEVIVNGDDLESPDFQRATLRKSMTMSPEHLERLAAAALTLAAFLRERGAAKCGATPLCTGVGSEEGGLCEREDCPRRKDEVERLTGERPEVKHLIPPEVEAEIKGQEAEGE